MASLIERHGELELSRHPVDFHTMADIIVGQQLSGKAADTIFRRVRAGLVPNEDRRLVPSDFEAQSVDQLRAFGLSRQKASYILDLASKSERGEIRYEDFPSLPDDEIIRELTAVKGIGVWTVQMLLMFSLERPDVFPPDDLGIRNGLVKSYGMETVPKRKEMVAFAERWAPYRSYASRYLWQSLDSAS